MNPFDCVHGASSESGDAAVNCVQPVNKPYKVKSTNERNKDERQSKTY